MKDFLISLFFVILLLGYKIFVMWIVAAVFAYGFSLVFGVYLNVQGLFLIILSLYVLSNTLLGKVKKYVD
ncbi:hypothetical protein KNU91_gp032 [Enterococcus phage nattely]|uniref:Uncharacterized protein n=2 Tax=Vipetofemvirus TaxID=2948949 RepID=A0ACA9ASG1_9CAUD|nr:hypothetical protein KNU91_gp032 [Enterococcus phage nattely]QIQ66199.1 hypothetical protein nattely_32 [Enterococcus phage nattely]CAD0281784.1 hypothetical protein [Enterococcus phage vB_EfaS_140]